MCKLAAVIVLRGQYLKEELLASFVQFCILEDGIISILFLLLGLKTSLFLLGKLGFLNGKKKWFSWSAFLHPSSLMSVKPPHLFCLNMS